jgi:hypothetical protein
MEEAFGPMPPAPDGSEFQMTGYLMRDRERFQKLGMLTEDLPRFLHGRHLGAEFWMDDQELPYYREHLLLHEVTHCVMTIVPGPRQPQWYLEGMAEFFGAHRTEDGGRVEFGVMPRAPNELPGFGRIGVIQREIRGGRSRSLREVLALGVREFAPQTSEPYAWSWALCLFLDRHPRYRERFHAIHLKCRTTAVKGEFERIFAPDWNELATEWEQFSHHMVENYDFERSAIDFQAGEPLEEGGSKPMEILADRGWQTSGVRLEAGRSYRVSANGKVILGKSTKPWLSGPEGISLRYSAGRPIGTLLAAIHAEDDGSSTAAKRLLTIVGAGPVFDVTPESAGTLYLRVNDAWNSLADNEGAFEVLVERE